MKAANCLSILIVSILGLTYAAQHKHIITVEDQKEMKKLLKQYTNLLVIFDKEGEFQRTKYSWVEDVAHKIAGEGNVAYVLCSSGKSSRSLCKSYSISQAVEWKHFRHGTFNLNYNRKMNAKSLLRFLKNPTEDAPWDEEPTASHVTHLQNGQELEKTIRKGQPMLLMFYVPWCGYCKKLKPDFAAAAQVLSGEKVLAGMNLEERENIHLKAAFNITGYPTLLYFENGQLLFPYSGEYTKDGLIAWMRSPSPPPKEKPKEDGIWDDTENNVVHLTDDTFQDFVRMHQSILVAFYAPWCGHCKAMKTDYREAAQIIRDGRAETVLAAVDATVNSALSEEFEIKSFPTLKYFQNSTYKYDVKLRKTDEIVRFALNPQEPPPPPPPEPSWQQTSKNVVHLSGENFKEELKKKKHAIVMFYAPWCGHCKKAKPEFEAAAEDLAGDRKVMLAAVDCTQHEDLCKSQGVEGYPTIKYFSYAKQSFAYSGGRERKDFVNFMADPKETAVPLPDPGWHEVPSHVNHLDNQSFDSFLSVHSSVLVVFYAPWCGHCKKLKTPFTEAAEELQALKAVGQLAAVDCTKESSLCQRFGVKGYPSLKHFSSASEYSDYPLSRTKEDFVKFMRNPSSYKKTVKETPPASWSDLPPTVVELTEATFASIAARTEKMLVMFYAPWCGYCNGMKKDYFDASSALKDKEPSSVLAVVNAITNRKLGERFSIKGYPSVKLLRFAEEVAEYNGDRSSRDIVAFVLSSGKSALASPEPIILEDDYKDLPSSVVSLSKEKGFLDQLRGSHFNVLLLFYTQGCPRCQEVKSPYLRAASRNQAGASALAVVNCSEFSEYCQSQGVNSFPALRKYVNGALWAEFDGSYTPEGVLAFLGSTERVDL